MTNFKLSVLDQSPVRSGTTAKQAIEETLELAKLADQLGYHRYWVAEHHNSSGLTGSAPEILLTRIGAETNRIRIGSGGVMLSHYSPYKVAEVFNLLETLYPERVDLGIGRAPGSDQITAHALAYGNHPRGPREYPSQVRDLISFLGGSFDPEHPLKRVKATPIPDSFARLWMLGSSDQSAQLAAHFGTPFSFAHFITDENGPEIMSLYQRQFQPSGVTRQPVGNIGIFVICAETEEEALELSSSRDLWRTRLDSGKIGPVPTVEEALNYNYSPIEEERRAFHARRNIVGTPSQVKEKLINTLNRYQVNEAVVVTITHSHKARLKSYELLAKEFNLQ
ncbi:LLM class flavin-dependent oxidoreductase [Sneathiella glossodoripedis]|uniref:LLM class flavin-dependent oxidoreductase n=1 Tax=Sneathiella glossodoripedis TaxID=418853 RepID=UPI0004703E16|nr:LLM class flavin-dependent oxidoreductase [Sneathiella glossodoripedis]